MRARWILFAGWAAFLVYAWPGFMTWDAMTQLAQARRGRYTDDHPPLMAIIWRFVEHFIHGPLGMMLLFSALFIGGCYAIMRTVFTERRAAIATVVVLLFPPVGTVIAMVLKDTLMIAFIAAGIPLLMSPRRWSWLGLGLMCAATMVRYNAPAATLPLVVLLWRFRGFAGWRRYLVASVAWVAITLGSFTASKMLADEETHYWYWSQALQDIAGTLEFSPDYSDAQMEKLLEGMPLVVHDHIHARFRAIWAPVDFRFLTVGDKRVLEKPTSAPERDATAAAWQRIVLGDLPSYLEYRWATFGALMRFDHAVWINAYTRYHMGNHEDWEYLWYDATDSKLGDPLHDAVKAVSRTGLFDPGPYLYLALLLLPLCLRDRLAGALLLSGALYQLAYFFLAPTADYRYSQYMVAMTVLGSILVFVQRYRRQAIVT